MSSNATSNPLTSGQIAQLASCPLWRVIRWRQTGKLAHVGKFGNMYIFDQSAVATVRDLLQQANEKGAKNGQK